MAPSSVHALSSPSSTMAHRTPNNESEELSMMFSTSPESPKLVQAPRHPVSGWGLLDSDDTFDGIAATGATMRTRAFSKSTMAETSGFSYNSCAMPISELFIHSSPLSQPHRLGAADSVSPAPSTPAIESSSPLERSHAISFTTQSNIRTGSSSRPGPVRSLDSTFSYDSYTTTSMTSPSTSFDEDGHFPASPDEQYASTSTNAKGKGKAIPINEVLVPDLITADAENITPLASPFLRQTLLMSAHDVLGHYSPDVADLMPPFELESRAFDWAEFERSLCSSPGAGTSVVSPISPVESATSGLGLTLSSPITRPAELINEQWPETNNLEHTTHPSSSTSVQQDRAVENPPASVTTPPTEHPVSQTPPTRVRRHAVSMYETPRPESSGRTVSYRPSVITHDPSHTRARADSNATSIMSRPHSAGPSPRLKKRSLTLPSWLTKAKEGKGSPVTGAIIQLGGTNGSPTIPGRHDASTSATRHRPRKLYKEKGRSQTIPATFPFLVTPEAILQAPGAEIDVPAEAVDASIKPVEQISLFETMLPRETRLLVFEQLIVVHQEDFERRLKEGKWSVAHASRERWVGKDAGMRELIKLSRVSKPWQNLVLDGQLWQSFDLKAFPGLSSSLVLRIAQSAGAFVQCLNLQGHSHLKPSSLLAISSSTSILGSTLGPSLPTTQLTTVNFVGCTSITTHSLHYLLYRSPKLQHLLVRGLDSVTNTTLTEILGPNCPNLVSLDIRRCSNINGSGLEAFAEQQIARANGRDEPCPLTTLKIAGMKDISTGGWRKVGHAFPLLQVLDCSYCHDLNDEAFREFVAWPNPNVSGTLGTWSQFSSCVELSSREAGFDPGDPTKYWRRVTSLRHLNVSGCKQISDLTCSSLAFTVPKLEILEIASVRADFHDEGLIRLFKTIPLIRKIDLEDATEITDAVLDCLIPVPKMPSPTVTRQQAKEEQEPQPGEMLEYLTISYAMTLTPEAISRLIRGCKKLRVLEADNTRITGSIIRDFVSRRRHREKGVTIPEGGGSEIVAIDCRAVSENAVKEMRGSTRPRRGWRGWEARDLEYEDVKSTGIVDATGAVRGPPLGQDECDEKRIVTKSFHSWVSVDTVTEQRNKLKSANGGAKLGNAELPRWLTQWSLGRRTPAQSTNGTPDEREDRGCVVQ